MAEIIDVRRAFLCCSAFACIVIAVGAIPVEDIPEQSLRFTEISGVDAGPILGVDGNESICIGVITDVRGIVTGANSDGTVAYGWWSQILVLKAAIAAFMSGAVVTNGAPTEIYPMIYRVLWGDECDAECAATHGGASKSVAVGLAHRMIRGNDLLGQNFPAVRSMIGALYSTHLTARLSTSLRTPQMGFYSTDPEMGLLRNHYSYFIRTMPTTTNKVGALFLQHLNYTRVDELGCEYGWDDTIRELYASMGVDIFVALFPVGQHEGWPPGYPPIDPPSPKPIFTDYQRKAQYDFQFQRLRENNAHVHLSYMGANCPVFDILSYAALSGLVGKGHLWLTQKYINTWNGQYLPFLRLIGPPQFGVVSPYAFVKPLDGSVLVETKAVQETDELHAWLKWIDDNGLRTKLVPEPELQSVITSEAFQNKGALIWRGTQVGNYHLFDCMYTILTAINQLLLQNNATNFTNDQLLDTMKKVKFHGVTGYVQFDDQTGERIVEEQLLQYNVWTDAKHTYDTVPLDGYRRLTDDNYAELKVWHRRLAEGHSESRRLATCATPADTSPANLGTYIQCITAACEDADGSIISTLSGNAVPNCQAALAAAAGNCDTDLAVLLPTLQPGTYLWTLCPGQCKSQCADQRCYTAEIETCTPTGLTPQALASYFNCLSTFTMDGSSSLLNTMTGGAMSNCGQLYNYVAANGGDCDFDLNALSSALPVGTPLKATCQATCAAVPPVCQVPAQLAGAALQVYFDCLGQYCYDADDGLVSTLSGGQIASCAIGLAAVAGDCTFDLSTLLPSLPAGTLLWQLCGVTCQTTCVAEKDKCQVPADPSDATLLQSYFSCTAGKCANAEDQLVSTLSGGQIASCAIGLAAVAGDCTFDLSTLLPSLPSGFRMWQLCGAECKAECEVATAPPSSCTVPSTPTPAALLPYFDCLRGICEDSLDSLVLTLSGGQIANCAIGLAAVSGDCTFDLSTLLPSLPVGFRMWQLCGATCSRECLANPGPNRTIDSYMQCRKEYCADSAPIVISNLTGGNVADCTALKTIAQDDCTYDVAKTMPRLGASTPLWKMCSSSCQCTDGSGPAPPPPPPPTCPELRNGQHICEFYEPGNLTVIGSFLTSLNMVGYNKPLFYDLSETPPPNLNLPCQLGQRYEPQTGSCLDCKQGTYTSLFGQTTCSDCPRGQTNPNDGASSCMACPWGKFSDEMASIECKSCTAGKYTAEPLQTECRSCKTGEYSLDNAKFCTPCESGKYQDQLGTSACRSCERVIHGSVSAVASQSNASCACPDGTYYRPSVGCQACVKGMDCNQIGNAIPKQIKGYQAYILDDATRNYKVYECYVHDWCPEGLPGSCMEHREGPSCSRLFGKGCPWYLASGIPVIGIVLALIAYKVTASSKYGTVTQVMIMSGNVSIAVVAMQAVNVYFSLFVGMPDELLWITDVTQVFMMQFNRVLPQCNIGQTFLARYSMGIVPPLAVIVVFLFLWAATGMLSRVSPRVEPFSLDECINVIGVILQVLYVMQCKDAFAFFNTVDHPSGQTTLKNFRDVIAWSDTHVSVGTMLVVAYLFIFYVIGTYCVFVWVVVNARRKVREKKFVKRFRFVLSRWRPECWHWGLLLLARNFFIAITPILARTHLAFQSVMYVTVLMGHALLEARYMPWAATVNTWFEVLISAILCIMVTGGLLFDDDPSSTPEESAMGVLMSSMFASVWFFVLLAIVWTVRWGTKDKRTKRMEARVSIACDLVSCCDMIAHKLESGQAGVQKAWKRFIENSGDYDQIVLNAAYSYVLRFSDPDPLRTTEFISRITSYNRIPITLNMSEKSEQPPEKEINIEGHVDMARMSGSMSENSNKPVKSVLEEMGLEAHGRLRVDPRLSTSESIVEDKETLNDAASEKSDETITL